MSLVVGVANGVASGNEGVTEEEEGGRGEVFKVDVGEGGRWLAGAVVPTKILKPSIKIFTVLKYFCHIQKNLSLQILAMFLKTQNFYCVQIF